MFGGLIILGLMLVFGVIYASTLPPEMTAKVWVVQNAGHPELWSVNLVAAGLRGELIAWTDGIFHSWGSQYYGKSFD